MVLLRVYTAQFGKNILEALTFHRPHPTLRQKKRIDPIKTDLQIFAEIQLDDCWDDAKLVEVYAYLRRGTIQNVPNSWENALAEMDAELGLRGYQL